MESRSTKEEEDIGATKLDGQVLSHQQVQIEQHVNQLDSVEHQPTSLVLYGDDQMPQATAVPVQETVFSRDETGVRPAKEVRSPVIGKVNIHVRHRFIGVVAALLFVQFALVFFGSYGICTYSPAREFLQARDYIAVISAPFLLLTSLFVAMNFLSLRDACGEDSEKRKPTHAQMRARRHFALISLSLFTVTAIYFLGTMGALMVDPNFMLVGIGGIGVGTISMFLFSLQRRFDFAIALTPWLVNALLFETVYAGVVYNVGLQEWQVFVAVILATFVIILFLISLYATSWMLWESDHLLAIVLANLFWMIMIVESCCACHHVGCSTGGSSSRSNDCTCIVIIDNNDSSGNDPEGCCSCCDDGNGADACCSADTCDSCGECLLNALCAPCKLLEHCECGDCDGCDCDCD